MTIEELLQSPEGIEILRWRLEEQLPELEAAIKRLDEARKTTRELLKTQITI